MSEKDIPHTYEKGEVVDIDGRPWELLNRVLDVDTDKSKRVLYILQGCSAEYDNWGKTRPVTEWFLEEFATEWNDKDELDQVVGR